MFRLAFTALVLSLALPIHAHAQGVPACNGTEPQRAAQAIERGDAAMGRATTLSARNRPPQAQAAYQEALAAYDEACAAGAELALERRALPLSRLGRAVPAIESLDVFLSAHPMPSLPEADRARIESNLHALERDVATLFVGSSPSSTVLLSGREIGTTPISRARFLPTDDVELFLRARGHRDHAMHISLAAGETQRVNVQLTPIAEVTPIAQARDASPPVTSSETESHAEAAHASPPALDPHAASPNLVPWIALSFGGAAATLGLGIGGSVWAADRRGIEDGGCFGVAAEAIPGCSAVRSEYDIAQGLQIAGYTLAAALTVTGAVLLVVMVSDDSAHASLACGAGPLSVACQGTF